MLLPLQASKDCVQKTIKRLEDKIQGNVLKQILYAMHSSQVCPTFVFVFFSALDHFVNV